MITIIELITPDAIREEGRRMHNALQCDDFVNHMLARGTRILTVRDEEGNSVANLAVDRRVVTNIVGPSNAHVSDELWSAIHEEIQTRDIELPVDLKWGGPRVSG